MLLLSFPEESSLVLILSRSSSIFIGSFSSASGFDGDDSSVEMATIRPLNNRFILSVFGMAVMVVVAVVVDVVVIFFVVEDADAASLWLVRFRFRL